MKRAKKAKRAAMKPASTFALNARCASTFRLIDERLQRCCDLLSCLDYCHDAELNLGSLALAARDLIDTARDDLRPFRREAEKAR